MLMKWKVVEHKILDYKVVLTFWQSMAIIIFKDHFAYFYFLKWPASFHERNSSSFFSLISLHFYVLNYIYKCNFIAILVKLNCFA